VDFGDIVLGKKHKFKIEVTNDGSTKSKLLMVDYPSKEYVKKIKIKKDKLKPGKSTTIELELLKEIPPGRFTTSFSLEVEGKTGSRVTVPIVGSVILKKVEADEKPRAKANK
jgi:uncharacterized membrane protein